MAGPNSFGGGVSAMIFWPDDFLALAEPPWFETPAR
jgi:hypothetical protein